MAIKQHWSIGRVVDILEKRMTFLVIQYHSVLQNTNPRFCHLTLFWAGKLVFLKVFLRNRQYFGDAPWVQIWVTGESGVNTAMKLVLCHWLIGILSMSSKIVQIFAKICVEHLGSIIVSFSPNMYKSVPEKLKFGIELEIQVLFYLFVRQSILAFLPIVQTFQNVRASECLPIITLRRLWTTKKRSGLLALKHFNWSTAIVTCWFYSSCRIKSTLVFI